MSHAEFLRPHWPGEDTGFLGYIRDLWHIGEQLTGGLPFETAIARLESSFPNVESSDKAIVSLASRLTILPASMTKNSIRDALAHGLDERAIHDVVLITALFAFMNRLADGTGVTIQDNRRAFAIELFGHDVVEDHFAWGQNS